MDSKMFLKTIIASDFTPQKRLSKSKKISLEYLSGAPMYLWGAVEGRIGGCSLSKESMLDSTDFLSSASTTLCAAQRERKSASRVARVSSGRIEGCGLTDNHWLFISDFLSSSETARNP
jgi:hypothetical protein